MCSIVENVEDIIEDDNDITAPPLNKSEIIKTNTIDDNKKNIQKIVQKPTIKNFKLFKCNLAYNKQTKSKVPVNLPKWQDDNIKTYTYEEFEERKDKIDYYNNKNKNLNAFGLKCGEKYGIFVVDIDDIDVYNELNEEYKFKTLTIKTKKGRHLYYQYDQDIPSIINRHTKIDIISKERFIFALKTQYEIEGKIYTYEIDNNITTDINKIDEDFKKFLLKNNYSNQKEKSNHDSQKKSTTKKSNMATIIVNNKLNENIDKLIENEDNVNCKFNMEMINLLPIEIVDEYNNWSNMVRIAINVGIDKEFVKLISRKYTYTTDEEIKTSSNEIEKLYNSYNDKEIVVNDIKLKYWCKTYKSTEYFELCIKYENFLDFHFDIINQVNLSNIFIKVFGDNVAIGQQYPNAPNITYLYKETTTKNKNNKQIKVNEWVGDNKCKSEKSLLKTQINKCLTEFFSKKNKFDNKTLYKLELEFNELKSKTEKTDEEKMRQVILNNKIKKVIKIIKNNQKSLEKVGTQSEMKAIAICVEEHFYNKSIETNKNIIFDTTDDEDYNIHYKDGYFNLNTKEFINRTIDNLVSKKLNYNGNYTREELINEIEEYHNIFKRTLSNERHLRLFRTWLLYSLIGNCIEQKALFITGDGSNGKSNIMDAFNSTFPLYADTIDSKTFNANNPNKHKQLFNMTHQPVRMLYIEEIQDAKIDNGELKNFTGGDGASLKLNILYQNQEAEIKNKANITASFNKCPQIENTESMNRRMLELPFPSKFFDTDKEVEIEKELRKNLLINDPNCIFKVEDVFLKDLTLKNKLKNERMKVAMREYIINGFEEQTPINVNDKRDFSELNEIYKKNINEQDEFKVAFDERYVITGNSEDRIHKDDLLDYFKDEKKMYKYKSDKLVRNAIKEKYNKLITYDKSKKLMKDNDGYSNYKSNGKLQGVYLNIKLKNKDDKCLINEDNEPTPLKLDKNKYTINDDGTITFFLRDALDTDAL